MRRNIQPETWKHEKAKENLCYSQLLSATLSYSLLLYSLLLSATLCISFSFSLHGGTPRNKDMYYLFIYLFSGSVVSTPLGLAMRKHHRHLSTHCDSRSSVSATAVVSTQEQWRHLAEARLHGASSPPAPHGFSADCRYGR